MACVINVLNNKSQMKNFKFKAKLWVWPGDTPWHFVSLDQEISKEIRDKNYLLPIKKDVRKKANLQDEEVVEVVVRVL